MKSGIVAQAWARAKKTDTTMSRKYELVGRKFEVQRKFREDWAATMLEKIQKEKSHTRSQRNGKYEQGEYMPLDLVIDAQGGAHRPAAVKAATNYVVSALALHAQGYRPMEGCLEPWLEWNTMTGRMEFFYIKRTYSQTFDEQWAITVKAYQSGTGAEEGTHGQEATSDTTLSAYLLM